MKRHHLEHILRASAVISECREFVVVGSQSILGQFPSAPPELLVSEEADLWPRENPELADLIDGSITHRAAAISTLRKALAKPQ